MCGHDRRLRILLLSSQEPATVLLREALARHADVATAWDSSELLDLLAFGPYDAFLCDCEYSAVAWTEICADVKQREPNLPIIMLCRLGGEREWSEVLAAGCFDLASAPYSERKLLSMIEHAVASQKARSLRTVA